jgi:hypothetical protein
MSLSTTRPFLLSIQMDASNLRRVALHTCRRVQEESIRAGPWEGSR